MNRNFINYVKDGNSVDELISSCKVLFESYFPSYIWKNTDFDIVYENELFSISISNKVGDSFSLVFSDSFLELLSVMKNSHNNFIDCNLSYCCCNLF